MNYQLRPATWEDFEAIDLLYTANMKPYVEEVATWDPTLLRKVYETELLKVIEVNGELAGITKLVENEDHFYLAEIQLKFEYRNLGIGSRILVAAQSQSRKRSKKLILKVVKGNPAQQWYEKRGFEVFDQTDTAVMMQWLPSDIG